MQSVGTMALQPHLSSTSPPLSFLEHYSMVSFIYLRPSLGKCASEPITQSTVQDNRGRPES